MSAATVVFRELDAAGADEVGLEVQQHHVDSVESTREATTFMA